MKTGLAKKIPLLLMGIVLLGSSGPVFADSTNKPYLKSFGGDVMTGGWFYSGTNCQTAPGSNYQDPNFSSASFSADSRNGGILTYTQAAGGNSGGGDSSQYGALSVGEIDGRRAGDGFYSAGALAAAGPTSVKTLSFANANSTYAFGGVFEGNIRQSNCVPDYYSKKPNNTININNLSEAIGRGSNDYSATPRAGTNFDLTNGNSTHTIPAGQRMTIYVNGNLYLDRNIVYDSRATVDNPPKFAVIVKGSIYIDSTVTELDGLYIAEPSDTTSAAVAADNGIIWTCHPDNQARLDFTYPPNCRTPLVVNGALIAKQINFLRVNGDIASSNTGEDGLATINSCIAGACNLSEAANYSPGMVMGGSFFDTSSGGSSNSLPIDSIVSLPPVF